MEFKILWLFPIVLFSYPQTTFCQTPYPGPTNPFFTAISPKIIQSNSIYQLIVSLEENSSPVLFSATISGPTGSKDKFSAQKQLSEGSLDIIEIPITKELSDQSYNLSLKATTVDGYSYEEWNYIFPDTTNKLLLIETDKPIYKPEDVVRFRVILLKASSLRPSDNNDTVDVTITDSQRNIIQRYKEENIQKGIFSSKFNLGTQINLGDWTIDVKSSKQSQSLQFRVAEYLAPKFKIGLTTPSYACYNNSKVTAKVKAVYTYGRGVKGTSIFKLYRNGYASPCWTSTVALGSDGTASVDIDLVKNGNLYYWDLNYEQSFRIEVTVTDTSGSSESDTEPITIYPIPYKVQFLKQSILRPGFPVTSYFKVTTPDGMPVSDPKSDAVKVTLPNACPSFYGTDSISLPVPPTGIVAFSLNTTSTYSGWTQILVNYKGATTYFNIQPNNISPAYPSGKTLMLTVKTIEPKIDQPIKINVKMNVNFDSINYIVQTRGQILQSDRLSLGTPTKEFTFQIPKINNANVKNVTLVAWVFQRDINNNNEVITDSVQISFTDDSAQNGALQVTFGKSTVMPGKTVRLSLSTKANSLVALKGVDQSVLLLRPDSDISAGIGSPDAEYQSRITSLKGSSGSVTSMRFEDSGFVSFLNFMPYVFAGGYYYYSYTRPVPPTPLNVRSGLMQLAGRSSTITIGGGITQGPVVRSDFRETWLWEEIPCQKSLTNFTRTVPDSLTSWVITGYSLNPQYPISFSPKTSLQVFKQFFLSLKLPYTVTEGEVFALEVLVHNHLTEAITAVLSVNNAKNQYEFMETKLKGSSRGTKRINVERDQVELVTFLIKATTFGKIDIEVKAISDLAGDALTRPLLVKPRGIRQTKNLAAFLDLRTTNSTNQSLTADFPSKRVAGADTMKISVIADIIGPALYNLNNLLQMPGGCAEQTLRYFVPDVVIQDYLIRSGENINSTIVDYLQRGYQSVVANRQNQGSFAYWGYSYSIWLTAYAVKSLAMANRYITVDQNVINQGLQFLVDKQTVGGGYVENYNSYLQGGTSGNQVALAAYVTLTFIETRLENITDPSYINATRKGLDYISTASISTLSPFTINLVAYVLHLADHPMKNNFSTASEKLAKRYTDQLTDYMYWDEYPTIPATRDGSTTSLAIEMTSYALMTSLLQNNIDQSLSIGRWLLRQRNSAGGFLSTQDTVVGITALTKLALRFMTSSKLQVIATCPSGNETFLINEYNRMVLQEAVLTPPSASTNTSDVKFIATGNGIVLAQLSWSYYVENVTFGLHQAFNLDVGVSTDSAGKLQLHICTAFIGGNSSNMALMEVNLPTGYTFLTSSLSNLLNAVPRTVQRWETEKDNTKANLYFNSLNATPICLDLTAEQVLKVANPALSFVEVYDYYNNTRQHAIEYFSAPKTSVCEVCAVYDDCVADTCTGNKIPEQEEDRPDDYQS